MFLGLVMKNNLSFNFRVKTSRSSFSLTVKQGRICLEHLAKTIFALFPSGKLIYRMKNQNYVYHKVALTGGKGLFCSTKRDFKNTLGKTCQIKSIWA